MHISTSDKAKVKSLFSRLSLPQRLSHKGQNGKVLIIGGSSLFHAASLWAAEVVCHFVDMVHYSSTVENEKIFHDLKKNFRNGIIVPQKDLEEYASQDEVILIGPGMMREGSEGQYTKDLTRSLVEKYPEKKFVFDAGALQMMDRQTLTKLKTTPILTPHQKEFEALFGVAIMEKNPEEKEEVVAHTAAKFNTVILLKAVSDYVSDGQSTYVIDGGNAGLTKGGTGDVLSGLTASFFASNSAIDSALLASVLLKATADSLFDNSGYWYNVGDIIKRLPEVLKDLKL